MTEFIRPGHADRVAGQPRGADPAGPGRDTSGHAEAAGDPAGTVSAMPGLP
jgi:hypothetical protein